MFEDDLSKGFAKGNDYLSLAKCKAILNDNKEGRKYSDEEVSQMRELLHLIAKINYENLDKLSDYE
ncbi:MAG: hypothetical protein COC01_02420 [Bacteroidetes bacterium]|nr:hypothetical protein [Bacteroidia bacterium]PCH69067.1 MAG: hypothetical protein COC01_02420 [Bacteroidota bacterium]